MTINAFLCRSFHVNPDHSIDALGIGKTLALRRIPATGNIPVVAFASLNLEEVREPLTVTAKLLDPEEIEIAQRSVVLSGDNSPSPGSHCVVLDLQFRQVNLSRAGAYSIVIASDGQFDTRLHVEVAHFSEFSL